MSKAITVSYNVVRWIKNEHWRGLSMVSYGNGLDDDKTSDLAKEAAKHIRSKFGIKCRVFVLPEGGRFGWPKRWLIACPSSQRSDELEDYIYDIQSEYDKISTYAYTHQKD